MKDGTLPRATIKPLSAPKTMPVRIHAETPRNMEPVLLATSARTTLHSASKEPTERSIPPAIITNVIPKASTMLIDDCSRILVKFAVVKKTGERKLLITQSPTSIPTIGKCFFNGLVSYHHLFSYQTATTKQVVYVFLNTDDTDNADSHRFIY